MTPEQIEKLRTILFERLVSGEPRAVLATELSAKLGDAVAKDLLDTSVQRIREHYGDRAGEALFDRIRMRRLGARHRGWKIFGWVLLVWGAIFWLTTLSSGVFGLPLTPVLLAIVILALVDFERNRRISEARRAVSELVSQPSQA